MPCPISRYQSNAESIDLGFNLLRKRQMLSSSMRAMTIHYKQPSAHPNTGLPQDPFLIAI